jgi:hypothetical protein
MCSHRSQGRCKQPASKGSCQQLPLLRRPMNSQLLRTPTRACHDKS